MAFTFPYLKSAFTSLAGANVDVVVLRGSIVNGGIIVQDLLPQPEGIKWINELADPTIQFSFVTTLPGPEEAELDSIVAAHIGPQTTSQGVRVFFKSTAPLVTDDSDSLFEVGDIWIDDTTKDSYALDDATVGAAVWNWGTGWGKARPNTLVKLRADLQTGGEAAPDAGSVLVTDGAGDFDLEGHGGSQSRDYFENYGPVTAASTSTPVTRMSQNPTFLSGRYKIQWFSDIVGSSGATVSEGRFSFDGVLIDSFVSDGRSKFNGCIERVLTPGSKAMLLEIAKDAGGGQAEMGKSVMRYTWIASS